jgi:hypothetical protein
MEILIFSPAKAKQLKRNSCNFVSKRGVMRKKSKKVSRKKFFWLVFCEQSQAAEISYFVEWI